MDVFTDVDLLCEVLDAASRRVPVYILLDEMNSQLFLDTAAKCRVNLNYVEVSKDLPYLMGVLRGCVLHTEGRYGRKHLRRGRTW